MVATQHSLRLCLVLKNLRENVIKRKYWEKIKANENKNRFKFN